MGNSDTTPQPGGQHPGAQRPSVERSPMERQGEAVRAISQLLLDHLFLPPTWSSVRVVFAPVETGWLAAPVIDYRTADGAAAEASGYSTFGAVSQLAHQLDQLQRASADQGSACISVSMELVRKQTDGDRISIGVTMNYDQDPGDVDGHGGISPAVAARLLRRFGPGALPAWVRERADEGA